MQKKAVKDLQQLYQEYAIASATFRTAVHAQGFIRTDIGDDESKYIWLRRIDHDKVCKMLANNQSPSEYCNALISKDEAFLEWE